MRAWACWRPRGSLRLWTRERRMTEPGTSSVSGSLRMPRFHLRGVVSLVSLVSLALVVSLAAEVVEPEESGVGSGAFRHGVRFGIVEGAGEEEKEEEGAGGEGEEGAEEERGSEGKSNCVPPSTLYRRTLFTRPTPLQPRKSADDQTAMPYTRRLSLSCMHHDAKTALARVPLSGE